MAFKINWIQCGFVDVNAAVLICAYVDLGGWGRGTTIFLLIFKSLFLKCLLLNCFINTFSITVTYPILSIQLMQEAGKQQNNRHRVGLPGHGASPHKVWIRWQASLPA